MDIDTSSDSRAQPPFVRADQPELTASDRKITQTGWRPRVVVVGAGFAGLEVTRALANVAVDVILVDRRNYHLFQPLLYQVATAGLSPADIAWPIRHILRRQRNAHVLMARVDRIDVDARMVVAEDSLIHYDVLVLATGARHSYFGNEDWEGVAPGLKKIDDATEIRRRLLVAFERAEAATDMEEQRRLLTFVVIGGGPTGVEMAGAIVELARHALASDFQNIDPRSARIILVEAGPRLLASFPERLSAIARRSLERLGVEVRTGCRVTRCSRDGIEFEGEVLEARTVVWAAGVMASPAGKWIGAELDRAGRVKVGPDLAVAGRPEIFVIGDTAAAAWRKGAFVPGIAPAAKQMGRYVAEVIAARFNGKLPPAPFRYRHQGDLATIGRKSAVVKLGRLQLSGFAAWALWGTAHVYFLIGLKHRMVVALNWLWNYATFQRGARLITGPAS